VTLAVVAGWIEALTRVLVGGAFVTSAIVALTHWAVRAGHLQPFGAWPRFVRGWSDPMLRPVESRLLRAGGNPQQAPWWLLGAAVLGGLALLAVVRWLLGLILTLWFSAQGGPAALLPLAVAMAFNVLQIALLLRVVASWFGLSPYGRVMRVAHALTDWLLEPIQRLLPTMGPFDFSPLVAYLLLGLARTLVMNAFF
jgi:YggT family protein